MQEFIANGRVAAIPEDAKGKTSSGKFRFKFDFACDSKLVDESGKPIPSFFHVQVYGKQAEVMANSLAKGSPILLKGEIIQRPYMNQQGERRIHQYIMPSQYDGITFLENRDAANRRRESLQSESPFYPEPLAAEEPF